MDLTNCVQAISSVVQAVSTVVLVGITVWYVIINNRLLKLQIEPVIELSIEIPNQTLVLENRGFDDVVKVLERKPARHPFQTMDGVPPLLNEATCPSGMSMFDARASINL